MYLKHHPKRPVAKAGLTYPRPFLQNCCRPPRRQQNSRTQPTICLPRPSPAGFEPPPKVWIDTPTVRLVCNRATPAHLNRNDPALLAPSDATARSSTWKRGTEIRWATRTFRRPPEGDRGRITARSLTNDPSRTTRSVATKHGQFCMSATTNGGDRVVISSHRRRRRRNGPQVAPRSLLGIKSAKNGQDDQTAKTTEIQREATAKSPPSKPIDVALGSPPVWLANAAEQLQLYKSTPPNTVTLVKQALYVKPAKLRAGGSVALEVQIRTICGGGRDAKEQQPPWSFASATKPVSWRLTTLWLAQSKRSNQR